ncbi:unnamed protein product [Lepeophtheirus salmonis]|uniref:(salmon louse) hypothetical protein n=1 Tax=Lepeophtheirus salmonis TaxID=72036 RepID=A0A7R8H8I5_LEPSM|nr:unnamed protein product [Lepeophtheirus salmonis]CAF2940543.1 unnamed protein product [Lepeophtheirus salmonis]
MSTLEDPIYGEYNILDNEVEDEWRRQTSYKDPFIHFKKYDQIMPQMFLDNSESFHNFETRDDDTWIVSFPKSGSTWLSELVWCLKNNMDFEKASTIHQSERIPFIDLSSLASKHVGFPDPFELAKAQSSPRIIKTHLSYEMLPPNVMKNKIKIIYILRNPRDVCVSLHNHLDLFCDYKASMEKHADYFLRDYCGFYFPFFSNIRGFIQNKDLPNIHIVTYEEMKEDISLVIDKIVDFLEIPRLDPDHKKKLMEYISINQMRNNSAVNRKNYTGTGDFLNKGIVGNWKTMLTDETIKGFEL